MSIKPKIAILHDAFLYRWGGERLVTLMAKSLGADLVSGFFSEWSFDPRELGFTGEIITLGKPVFMKWLRHEILRHRFLTKTAFLANYDIVIFSGNCLEAVRNLGPNTKKVYYCHTPPRYIFDLRSEYLANIPSLFGPVAHFILDRQAKKYIWFLSCMDVIITNSKNVQDRLRDFTGYESKVIYPPTDVRRFSPRGDRSEEIGDREAPYKKTSYLPPPTSYFLSYARLSPPKRVDLIVDAFLDIPEEHLILTYGKNDPLKESIIAKIRNSTNIQAVESPDDARLISLIWWATATIYIPIDEDFGMSPVESMACGTPVIGAAEWGLLETVIEGKTGKLISIMNRESWITQLKKVIQDTKKEEWEEMKDTCMNRASDFSLDAFEKKLKSLLHI